MFFFAKLVMLGSDKYHDLFFSDEKEPIEATYDKLFLAQQQSRWEDANVFSSSLFQPESNVTPNTNSYRHSKQVKICSIAAVGLGVIGTILLFVAPLPLALTTLALAIGLVALAVYYHRNPGLSTEQDELQSSFWGLST